MAAASDVISNCPSLPLFNHPPTYLLLSLFPPCLSVFTARHFIHPCTSVTNLLLSEWNDEAPCGRKERRSNPTPSLCISEAPSVAETHATLEENRGQWKPSGKAVVLQDDAPLTFYSRLGSLRHIAILSLSLLLARIVQLFIISYFCSFPPAQRCAFMKVCLNFLYFFTFDFSRFPPL